jgi:hypothetical protein
MQVQRKAIKIEHVMNSPETEHPKRSKDFSEQKLERK